MFSTLSLLHFLFTAPFVSPRNSPVNIIKISIVSVWFGASLNVGLRLNLSMTSFKSWLSRTYCISGMLGYFLSQLSRRLTMTRLWFAWNFHVQKAKQKPSITSTQRLVIMIDKIPVVRFSFSVCSIRSIFCCQWILKELPFNADLNAFLSYVVLNSIIELIHLYSEVGSTFSSRNHRMYLKGFICPTRHRNVPTNYQSTEESLVLLPTQVRLPHFAFLWFTAVSPKFLRKWIGFSQMIKKIAFGVTGKRL